MRIIITSSLCIAWLLVGSTDRNEQAGWYLEKAKANFSSGSVTNSAYHIDNALGLPNGNAKVRALFNESPAIKAAYISRLKGNITALSAPAQVPNVSDSIQMVVRSNVLSASENSQLIDDFNNRLLTGNQNDGIPFLLGDEAQSYDVLRTPDQLDLIFKRTLRFYRERVGVRHVSSLLDYAHRNGAGSADELALRAQLSSLNITASELEGVEKFYPEFAAIRRAQITKRVYFSVKNGDRLFADDVFEKLKSRLRGIEWTSKPTPGTLELVVERVRSDEKILPESTQTVTYGYSDVNALYAALFMPRNASYMFDLTSGGATIDYGYVITAREAGKPTHEQVARGKVEAAYGKCLNARVQNVFGGTTAATFIANDNMQSRCARQTAPSLDDLRSEVLDKLITKVLEVPPIRTTNEMNL
jgi:hypothetical protein